MSSHRSKYSLQERGFLVIVADCILRTCLFRFRYKHLTSVLVLKQVILQLANYNEGTVTAESTVGRFLVFNISIYPPVTMKT